MVETGMMFKSLAGEAAFMAAYDAALARWPVPYTVVHVPTRFGSTHVIICGPETGPPLVLLHAAGTSSTVWRRNVAALSQSYRTYLVDIAGVEQEPVLGTVPLQERRGDLRFSCTSWLPCWCQPGAPWPGPSGGFRVPERS